MTGAAVCLLLLTLLAQVGAQILLKRAMDSHGLASASKLDFGFRLTAGTGCLALSFFLTLGLLRNYDLSYIFPFQGVTVILISLAAALMLHEKLSLQLIVGSIAITAGVVLVSLS